MTLHNQLREYIRRRAEVEGVEFDLSLEFFEEAVETAPTIFGVRHDGTEIVSDDQEPYPGFFEEVKLEQTK